VVPVCHTQLVLCLQLFEDMQSVIASAGCTCHPSAEIKQNTCTVSSLCISSNDVVFCLCYNVVAGNEIDEDDIHLIIEYKRGDKWGEYEAPRANRFVLLCVTRSSCYHCCRQRYDVDCGPTFFFHVFTAVAVHLSQVLVIFWEFHPFCLIYEEYFLVIDSDADYVLLYMADFSAW